MKIVHVITRLLRAGAEENTLSSCLHQLQQGHEVYLVHGQEFDAQYVEGLPAELKLIKIDEMVHPINPLKDLAAARALRNLYRRIRPDVVHTHQSKAGILGRVASIGCSIPAVVHTVHIAPFLNVGGIQRIFYVAVERGCALVTDKIIDVSEGMRQACLTYGVGNAAQHIVIRSGMPVERFVNARAPVDWRARIGGWRDDRRPRIVLMLAAFEPRKRQERFLEAMSTYLRDRSDLCVVFAGQGSRLEACRDLAAKMNITEKVKFLGHDPKPEELIALADVCVLTSEREGLPRVVVQYLAGGAPVVVAALPGIQEIVADGVNGRVTASEDLSQSAKVIVDLLDDEAQLSRLQRGARETDVAPWGAEKMGGEIEKVYRLILER